MAASTHVGGVEALGEQHLLLGHDALLDEDVVPLRGLARGLVVRVAAVHALVLM
jgi:hypothetical protein